jgi:hypothetical protein
MSQRDDRISPRHATLWISAAFIFVAIIGYGLLPGLDALWVIIGVFGFLAIGQAFALRVSEKDR